MHVWGAVDLRIYLAKKNCGSSISAQSYDFCPHLIQLDILDFTLSHIYIYIYNIKKNIQPLLKSGGPKHVFLILEVSQYQVDLWHVANRLWEVHLEGSHIFLTKYQTFLSKFWILCHFKRNMFTYALLTCGIYCISGLSKLLGVYSFQKEGIWYDDPLLLTNVLSKGHTISYLVRNVWYLVISYAVCMYVCMYVCNVLFGSLYCPSGP